MSTDLQPLPLSSWESTKTTLHLYTQIVGKVRLALHPYKNHWWHVTSYLTTRGLSTGPIPYENKLFEIEFDFIDHKLLIKTNFDELREIQLGCSISEFYHQLMTHLASLSINVNIVPNPFDAEKVHSDIPFDKDNIHHDYNPKYTEQFWKILCAIYRPFQIFNGNFYGKVTPLHFFWHSFDYVLTLFSGKVGPSTKGMDSVSAGAYSHEVISFGFWPGDENLPEPAFYSYSYPEPKNLEEQKLYPDNAFWVEANNMHMAILKYHDWLKVKNRDESLVKFFESAYLGGSSLAKWDKTLYQPK